MSCSHLRMGCEVVHHTPLEECPGRHQLAEAAEPQDGKGIDRGGRQVEVVKSFTIAREAAHAPATRGKPPPLHYPPRDHNRS